MITDPDQRIAEVLRLLNPSSIVPLWHGGPTIPESLKNVSVEQAIWKPTSHRHSIWALVLHMAYWKFEVRNRLDGVSGKPFSRQPNNFPALPESPSEENWASDKALLNTESDRLVRAIEQFDPTRLDEFLPSGNRMVDQLFGIAIHDVHHISQIELTKKLYEER